MAKASSRWIQRTHLFRADEYVCAACGYSADRPYKICPSCAALMKRGKYDPSWVDEAEGFSVLLDDDL